MKHSFFAIIIAGFMAICALNASQGIAQVTQANCPGPGSGCSSWTTFGMSVPLGEGAPDGCTLSISAQYRICAGVLQYQYTSFSKTGNCSFWQDSTIMQLVDLMVIEGSMADAYHTSGLPLCPTSVSQVEFYVSACYIWQDCKYNTTVDAPICTPPDNNPGPAPGSTVDVWSWHGCGNSCCKRTYNVCVQNSTGLPATPTNYTAIRLGFEQNIENLTNVNVTIVSKVRMTPCDGNNGIGTQWSTSCNDGC